MAKIGYGVTKKEIPTVVKSVLDEYHKDLTEVGAVIPERKFEDNLPSLFWVYRFLNRWPELSARAPENLGYQRAYVTEEQIRAWFEQLEKFLLEEHNIVATEFLQERNSSRVFNLDESGFPLAGTNGKLKIITNKGAKNVYRMSPDTREQVTVLGCASSDGSLSKPFVIFPGVRPNFEFQDVNPDDYVVGSSANGWMSADCFFGWLANHFYPSVVNKVAFPIIVFMDGHTSHINLAVSEFCREKNIILYCFPPHASHVVQPLDVSVYGPLKKYWNASLQDFSKKYKGLSMSRRHFFSVFDVAWKKAVDTPNNIRSGFRKTGLLPFQPEAVSYDKLMQHSTNVREKKKSVNVSEKVGMMRMFQVIEESLTKELRDLFNERKSSGYDASDETHLGVLWTIYNSGLNLINGVESSVLQQVNDPKDTEEVTAQELPELSLPTAIVHINDQSIGNAIDLGYSPQRADSAVLSAPQGSSTPIRTENETVIEDPEEETSSSQGTSAVPQTSYAHWEYSPFKEHLKINDTVLITRKVSKTKSKVPPAVSGKALCNMLKKQQEEKRRALEDKENRKKLREERKQQKEQNKLKRGRTTKHANDNEVPFDESESDHEVVFDDNSDDSLNVEQNVCGACHGSERWDENDAWIGCSTCPYWFHKDCISEDVVAMSNAELLSFKFYCRSCEKILKNKPSKKKN